MQNSILLGDRRAVRVPWTASAFRLPAGRMVCSMSFPYSFPTFPVSLHYHYQIKCPKKNLKLKIPHSSQTFIKIVAFPPRETFQFNIWVKPFLLTKHRQGSTTAMWSSCNPSSQTQQASNCLWIEVTSWRYPSCCQSNSNIGTVSLWEDESGCGQSLTRLNAN